MTRDDRASFSIILVASVALVALLFVNGGNRHPRAPRRTIAPTASSTSTTSTTVAGLGIHCVDRNGFPVRTDRNAARRAHLACPTPEGTP